MVHLKANPGETRWQKRSSQRNLPPVSWPACSPNFVTWNHVEVFFLIQNHPTSLLFKLCNLKPCRRFFLKFRITLPACCSNFPNCPTESSTSLPQCTSHPHKTVYTLAVLQLRVIHYLSHQGTFQTLQLSRQHVHMYKSSIIFEQLVFIIHLIRSSDP